MKRKLLVFLSFFGFVFFLSSAPVFAGCSSTVFMNDACPDGTCSNVKCSTLNNNYSIIGKCNGGGYCYEEQGECTSHADAVAACGSNSSPSCEDLGGTCWTSGIRGTTDNMEAWAIPSGWGETYPYSPAIKIHSGDSDDNNPGYGRKYCNNITDATTCNGLLWHRTWNSYDHWCRWYTASECGPTNIWCRNGNGDPIICQPKSPTPSACTPLSGTCGVSGCKNICQDITSCGVTACPDNSSCGANTLPTVIIPGQSQSVNVSLNNTGTSNWNSATHQLLYQSSNTTGGIPDPNKWSVLSGGGTPDAVCSGMISQWKFNDSAAIDSVGANNGTLTGTTVVAGPNSNFSNARSVSGNPANTNYITVPANTTLEPTSAITLAGWFYFDSFSTNTNGYVNLIACEGGLGATSGVCLYQNTVNPYSRLKFFIITSTGGGVFVSSKTLSTGTWYHVALTYNSATSQAILYLNGNTSPETFSVGGTINWTASPPNLNFGNWPGIPSFNGSVRLDDMAIWGRAISGTEVQTIYTKGAGLSCPDGKVNLPSSPIAPNGSANFSFNITAPATTGTYTNYWRMTDSTSANGAADFGAVCGLATVVGNPTCTVNTPPVTPSPVTVTVGRTVSVCPSVTTVPATGVSYTSAWTSANSAIASITAGGSPCATLTGVAAGSTTINMTVNLSPAGTCSQTLIPVTVKPPAWWQVVGGDLYANGVTDNISAIVNACSRYIDLK